MNTDTARRFNMLAAAVSALTAVLVMAGCGGKDAPKTPAVDAQAEIALDTAAILVDSRDGKRYKIVTIGTQTWMAENLNYDIPDDTTDVCYENKEANCVKYGRGYLWNTALTVCPAGWHLPTDAEWDTLVVIHAGGETTAGTKLKSKIGWKKGKKIPTGTNDYGFSALPYGAPNGASFWWSATESENRAFFAWSRTVHYNSEELSRVEVNKTSLLLTVRCLSDMPKTPAATEAADPYNIEMVFVEGGTFLMGCASKGGDCYSGYEPAHKVTVSNFYMGRYEITQKQWLAVMDSFQQFGDFSIFFGNGIGDNNPVYNVSWNDVMEFIPKLNAKTGKKYRLPTEAEWEYAARGGNKSKGYTFSGSNTSGEVSWNNHNSGDKPSVLVLDGPSEYYNIRPRPVGTKRPNELGLYDMSGNVEEWVNDWKEDYSPDAQTNPQGPSSGTVRVARGGSWFYGANWGRVYARSGGKPEDRMSTTGFRLAHDANTEGKK